MRDLIDSEEFKKLEQEYKFLSRAREHLYQLEQETYVVLDCETTGLEAKSSEIIEIAALKVERKEVKDIFNQLIKPRSRISEEITRITGISNEIVEGSPSLNEVAAKFLSFIEGSTLVIHNAEFDLAFINHHIFTPRKKTLKNQVVCTLKASRYLLPHLTSHKLTNLAQHFGIPARNSHRALGDVETTYELWFKLIPLLREKCIFSKEDLRKIPA